MNVLKSVLLLSLLCSLNACGKMVEFGAEPDASAAADGGSGDGSAGTSGGTDSGTDSGIDSGVDSGIDGSVDDDDGGIDMPGDTVAPTVLTTIPGAVTGVPVDTRIKVTFSERIKRSTLNAATFTVMQGTTPIAGVIKLVGNTATFTPSPNLTDLTPYTVTISTGVTDRAGNPLATDYEWTFTTGDDTRPTVVTVSPNHGAIEVDDEVILTVTFSEDIETTTFNPTFTLTRGIMPIGGTVSLVGSTATFTPNSALADGIYTANISASATDTSGNTLAMAKTWMFSVGDESRPFLVSTIPENEAVDVDTNTLIVATFSEDMEGSTITDMTFTVMEGLNPVDGVVVVVGKTATFTPDDSLLDDTDYTVTISSDVTDLFGNALVSTSGWSFTTGTFGPRVISSNPEHLDERVISSNPEHLDERVPLNKEITALFDEDVTVATVTDMTFLVTGPLPLELPVDGDVLYDPLTRIATFIPDDDLLPNTTYTVTITTDVEDLVGNPMEQDKVWTFTTGTMQAQLVDQLPVVLTGVSNFAILGAAAITNIPTSMITGDVGLDPAGGSSVSGFSMPGTCPEVVGEIYVVDATGPACALIDTVILSNAKLAAAAAYLDATASVRGTPQVISGNLNGLTLYPGLYESGSTIEISAGGILYLDAQGDSNAVFIIRSATAITTLSTSQVILTKGAKAANVYWTAGSAITLGVGSTMKGTMIASTALSLLTGAKLEGRAINQGSLATAVTLDKATVTLPLP